MRLLNVKVPGVFNVVDCDLETRLLYVKLSSVFNVVEL